MKTLLFLSFMLTSAVYAQDATPASPAKGTGLSNPELNPADLQAAIQQVLQAYKQIFAQAKPLFDAADIQLPKELLGNQSGTTSASSDKQGQSAAATPQGASLAANTTLSTGTLQTGGLPLSLPSVDPTTEPISQYQMWRKAARDKALRDRYLELKSLAKGQ